MRTLLWAPALVVVALLAGWRRRPVKWMDSVAGRRTHR